jgi:RNA polymerase sigma factor (sigma-70 family)
MDELFRAEQPRLTRYFKRRHRVAHEVQDLVQEAFVRMVAASADRVPDRPGAYLQRTVRNLMIDVSRRRTKQSTQDIGSESVEATSSVSHPPTQEWAIEANDLMRHYRAALDELTPRTREVFLLHRVDDLTYAQIAMQLDITIATVEYHISRALVHLDKALRQ